MSIKKVEEVKADKGFKIWDLIVYGVIIVIIAALFLTFFFINKNNSDDGIQVMYRGNVVFVYYYDNDECSSVKSNYITITQNNSSTIKLKFVTSDKKGYNIIKIDKKNKKVSVTDANCSTHKDCVYTPDFMLKQGGISCVPHNLLIQPVGYVEEDDGIVKTGQQ
jgi:hypothetical protein